MSVSGEAMPRLSASVGTRPELVEFLTAGLEPSCCESAARYASCGGDEVRVFEVLPELCRELVGSAAVGTRHGLGFSCDHLAVCLGEATLGVG